MRFVLRQHMKFLPSGGCAFVILSDHSEKLWGRTSQDWVLPYLQSNPVHCTGLGLTGKLVRSIGISYLPFRIFPQTCRARSTCIAIPPNLLCFPRIFPRGSRSTKQEGQDRSERPSRNVLLKIPVLVVQNRRKSRNVPVQLHLYYKNR